MLHLYFAKGNAKIKNDTYTFSLPAGHTCPCAKECFSKADRKTGKISDGKFTKFRCYAVSAESLFLTVRKSRWNNFELLKHKSTKQLIQLLNSSVQKLKNAKKIRIHASGDFFSESYFLAWVEVARLNPNIIFYGYTKRISFLVKHKKIFPKNFIFVASYGGKEDDLIDKHRLVTAKVVFSVDEAKKEKLAIDHDDSSLLEGKNFALLLHGVQPKETEAAKAWQKIKISGIGGYKKDYFK